MKNGIQTTEFWMAAASMFVVFANDMIGIGLDPESVYSIVGAAMAYIGGRSWVKGKDTSA